MTVEKIGKTAMLEEDAVWGTWFEKIGNRQVVQRETFPPVTLEKAGRTAIGVVSVTRR